jgi:CheY-like chemotaxis protein
MSKTIFVIEDDEAICSSILELLDYEGYQTRYANNGQEALDALAASAALPDLILLDLMMPVMDGFAFCEHKRNLPRLAHIPTIVMSADGHVERKQNETGATAYLKKPVDIDDLLQQVAACLLGTP